jgi:formylglycine-generating enzyme required for sulfatase activity
VIRRALAEDRSNRFATVQGFGEALDHALAVPRRRHRVWIIASAAAVTACGFLGFAASRRGPSLTSTRKPESRLPVSPRERPVTPREGQARAVAPSPLGSSLDARSGPPAVLTNSVGMRFVLLPKGTFFMGSPETDAYAKSDEKPRHQIVMENPFYLGACEVTVGEFRAFVEATHYRTKPERDGKGGAIYDHRLKTTVFNLKLNWRNPGFQQPQADDEPVVQVCREDVSAFCDWLTEREGVHYRLPTEAEWEYGCRAGSDSLWCFGNDREAISDYAWFKGNADYTKHPVGRKYPNAFGLYDMYGNVWEMCRDRYLPGYDRPDSSGSDGASTQIEYVIRGGSLGSGPTDELRSASRRGATPGFRYFSCGFRVRRALSPANAGVRSP